MSLTLTFLSAWFSSLSDIPHFCNQSKYLFCTDSTSIVEPYPLLTISALLIFVILLLFIRSELLDLPFRLFVPFFLLEIFLIYRKQSPYCLKDDCFYNVNYVFYLSSIFVIILLLVIYSESKKKGVSISTNHLSGIYSKRQKLSYIGFLLVRNTVVLNLFLLPLYPEYSIMFTFLISILLLPIIFFILFFDVLLNGRNTNWKNLRNMVFLFILYALFSIQGFILIRDSINFFI